MNAKCRKIRSDQVFKMLSTSFDTTSSVKNMKSIADAGKQHSSFCARVRCNAQFVTMSSCARHFFKHLNVKCWRTTRYTKDWWIPVSHEIWRVVLWLFGAPFWLKINSSTESTLSSVPHCEVVRSIDALSYYQRFSILFTIYSNQKPSNLSQEIL